MIARAFSGWRPPKAAAINSVAPHVTPSAELNAGQGPPAAVLQGNMALSASTETRAATRGDAFSIAIRWQTHVTAIRYS